MHKARSLDSNIKSVDNYDFSALHVKHHRGNFSLNQIIILYFKLWVCSGKTNVINIGPMRIWYLSSSFLIVYFNLLFGRKVC